MEESDSITNRATTAAVLLTWAGRVTAILLLGLVLLIFVGEGLPNLAKTSVSQDVQFAGLVLVCVGLGVGCFRDGIGGVLTLGGLALFYLMNYLAVGRWPGGAFPWFAVPSALFLASFAVRKAQS